MVRESRAQGVGHREDELSQPDGRDHVSQQIERGGGHAAAHTRGAERAEYERIETGGAGKPRGPKRTEDV